MRALPPAAGDALTFGAYLRRSRELRDLPLAEVAEATRLPLRILEALEADDHAALQDRAYALLVARTCAGAIGLDPEETALRLEEELQQSDPPPPPEPSRWRRAWAARPRQAAPWVVVGATVLACAAVLLRR